MRTHLRASGPSEHGAALPLVLLAMLSLSVLGLAFAAMSSREPLIAQNHLVAAQAFHIAEAGIEHAKRELLAADVDALVGNSINFAIGGTPRSFAGGTYSVQVLNNPSDPGPADRDGIVFLYSTGSFGTASRVVRVLLKLPVQDVPAALYLNSRRVRTVFAGDSFLISGNDTCPPGAICAPSTTPCAAADGCPTGGSSQTGIGLTNQGGDDDGDSKQSQDSAWPLGLLRGTGLSNPVWDSEELDDQVSETKCSLRPAKTAGCENDLTQPERREQVQGLGGNPSAVPPVPSVAGVTSIPVDMTLTALRALTNDLFARAERTLSSGTHTINLTRNGEPDGPPQITVADVKGSGQHVTLEGTGVGRGILIVKGRVTLGGSYRYEGLIISWGYGGGPDVVIRDSAKIFGGVIGARWAGNRFDFEIRNSARLVRSLKGLEFARQAIGSQTLAWRECPPTPTACP